MQAPFVASYASFNLAQDGLIDAADRRAKGARGLGRVPLENVLKIFWREVILRVKAAARQQRVRQAHDGGVAEFDAYRELIVLLEKGFVNDAEYVATVVQPVFVRELRRHGFKLLCKADARLDAETSLECRGDGTGVFAAHLPWRKRTRVFSRSRVRHVKDVPQPRRIAAIVHERDALRPATDIPPHTLCPHVVPGASRSIRTLCVN